MLIRTIESFLRRTGMPATKFGRLAAQDPRFVLDLRMGREPRSLTELRIMSFIAGYEAALTPQLEAARQRSPHHVQ